mmetsp:Transcript_27997/g.76991  ORF Transcript_27997/g.76991 Transcript_27997/m.76991 type:complete len:348 (-) Transcript_27997:1257-2300(-)
MKGCRVVLRMYCSLCALLVIFWALNLALSMSFIAKSSPVSLCRTRLTLPNAPSPSFLTSTKSSKLTCVAGRPSGLQHSESSRIEERNVRLSAPRPALSMKEEMPQFVTARQACPAASARWLVRRNSSCSASLPTVSRGTWYCCASCLTSAAQAELSSALAPSAGQPGLPGGTSPSARGSEEPDVCSPRLLSSRDPEAPWLGGLPASAFWKSSWIMNSGLLRSKKKLRGFTAKSAGDSPLQFLSLKFTLGSRSSSCTAPKLCLRAATWIAVSPSTLAALRNSGSSLPSCFKHRTAAGDWPMAARCRAVLRVRLPVRRCKFARSVTSKRMQSTCPRSAARCSGARPSGP